MTYRSITVIIPPEMSDYDDSYSEVTDYVAACTGFNCKPDDDLHSCDRISCDAYFEDDKGNIWHGQLNDLPYPDGSQKYTVDLEKKAEQQ
jgi:hypothetical protein